MAVIEIMGVFIIYQLVDPRNGLPFYVGYTAYPEQRLQEHLATAYLASTAKEQRILELKSLGLRPTMEEIETVEGTALDAMKREIYWIYHLKQQGMPLTNVTRTSDRSRHTFYLDKSIVNQVDQAFRTAVHDLFPAEIEKADYLEACLTFALEHLDEVMTNMLRKYEA